MEQNFCVECENTLTTFCKRCEVYVCEFHIQTHLNFKMCEICLTDTCDEMMNAQGVEGIEKHTDGHNGTVCFRCHAQRAFKEIGITINGIQSKINDLKTTSSIIGDV